MIKKILLAFVLISYSLAAQENDADLTYIKKRMDSVKEFTADVKLKVDINFINMPDKTAKIEYKKQQPIKVLSDDFVLIPKRGMDLSFNELFKYDFITVDRGIEKRNGKSYKVLNLIPTDNRSDYSIAKVLIDTINRRIVESDIQTKKDGAYVMKMNFKNQNDILPNNIEVNFEIERVKIPIRYMTKEATVDKQAYKADGIKTGKIYLTIDYLNIVH